MLLVDDVDLDVNRRRRSAPGRGIFGKLARTAGKIAAQAKHWRNADYPAAALPVAVIRVSP